jgi:predicted deacetylase
MESITMMARKPAEFLIRFDDLCPTMSKERFDRFLSLLAHYRIQPILAVVPENQDPELMVEPPDPEFWDRMRALEKHGATIAMHGYRHLCINRGRSLLNLHQETEFAGVQESTQRDWIRSGLQILRSQGLCPRLFVAPRHGFDQSTVRVLHTEGFGYLSDGFAKRPFTRGDVVWIPQQLWEPVQKKTGLWTICIHPNTASASLEKKLETFLNDFAPRFTSFDRVLKEHELLELRWPERLAAKMAYVRVGKPRKLKPKAA